MYIFSVLWTGSQPKTGHEQRQGCSRCLPHFASFLAKDAAVRAQKWVVALSLFEEQECLLLTGLWGCEALLEMDIAVPVFVLHYIHRLLMQGSSPEAEGCVSSMTCGSTQHTQQSHPPLVGGGCSPQWGAPKTSIRVNDLEVCVSISLPQWPFFCQHHGTVSLVHERAQHYLWWAVEWHKWGCSTHSAPQYSQKTPLIYPNLCCFGLFPFRCP